MSARPVISCGTAVVRHIITALGIVLVGGCSSYGKVPEDRFPEAAGDALCQRWRECERGSFERDFYSMSDCREHLEREFIELVDLADDLDCEYDSRGAGDALNNLLEMSCEDFYEGEFYEDYDKIWDDCSLVYF